VKEFAPNARIAHLDVDASEIGKVKNVDWAHVADAKRGLAQLLEAGAGFRKDWSRWRAHVGELRRKHPLDYNRGSAIVQSEYVLETLNGITRGCPRPSGRSSPTPARSSSTSTATAASA
jgi:acetolactate synthase-1/2/3 large subunit